MRSHGLKVLGLSLMAIVGLMAFAAVGAQAQAFLVNLTTLLATVTGSQLGEGKLLVQGRGIDLKCPEAKIEEGKILDSLGKEALAKATFLKCKTYKHNTTEQIKNCIIKGGSEAEGGTVAALARALPVLHGGKFFVLFEPHVAGQPFATVSYEANKGCVLPLNNPVTGAVSAEVIEGNPATLIFSEAIQLLTGDTLNFGVFPSYITATAHAEATGEHTGDKLGVH